MFRSVRRTFFLLPGWLLVSAGAVRSAEPITLPAETPTPIKLTIEKSVELSQSNYPQLRARIEQQEAAKQNVLAQKLKEYVPDALTTWEQLAATHNKQTQILFGNPVLPPNPGPGLDEAKQTFHGTFFSGAGYLFDWTPIDFGLHKARISEAKARFGEASANLSVTRLDVAVNAGLTFMNAVRAKEAARAESANVRRMEVVVSAVQDLVESGLRPAADVSLAQAQLADARNGLIKATQQLEIANAQLSAAVGEPNAVFDVVEAPIEDTTEPPVLLISTPQFASHPLAVAQRSVIGTIVAHNQVISKSNYPVIHWLGGMNWRGSGLDTKAHWQKKDAYGWLPREGNWNVGMMINWNLTDIIKNRQDLVVQRHLLQAQRHNYQQIIQNLTSESRQAQAMIKGSIALAENAPLQLRAAEQAELRIRTRYQTGLATIGEVAEAERLLTLAQVQAAIAKIGVWQALLAAANNRGDIAPFLQQVAAARHATNQGM